MVMYEQCLFCYKTFYQATFSDGIYFAVSKLVPNLAILGSRQLGSITPSTPTRIRYTAQLTCRVFVGPTCWNCHFLVGRFLFTCAFAFIAFLIAFFTNRSASTVRTDSHLQLHVFNFQLFKKFWDLPCKWLNAIGLIEIYERISIKFCGGS